MLVIAVGQQGSVLGAVGTGVAKLVTEKTGRPMRVRVTSGMDAIVGAGDAELGVSASDSAHLSSNGLRHYEGRPQTRLRLALPGPPLVLGFIVPSEAPQRTLEDLKGLSVPFTLDDFALAVAGLLVGGYIVFWYPKIAYAITFPTPARVGISMTEILAIAAVVGLIVGSAAFTGLGFTLSLPLLRLGEVSLFLFLAAVALISIVLGMGLPGIAIYFMQVALIVAALVEFGILPIAAHFFIYYFGTFPSLSRRVHRRDRRSEHSGRRTHADGVGGGQAWHRRLHRAVYLRDLAVASSGGGALADRRRLHRRARGRLRHQRGTARLRRRSHRNARPRRATTRCSLRTMGWLG